MRLEIVLLFLGSLAALENWFDAMAQTDAMLQALPETTAELLRPMLTAYRAEKDPAKRTTIMRGLFALAWNQALVKPFSGWVQSIGRKRSNSAIIP